MAAAHQSAKTPAYHTGCRDPLGQLYHHHQPWLQRLLSRWLGCGESAADLAQDAFAHLLCFAESLVEALEAPTTP